MCTYRIISGTNYAYNNFAQNKKEEKRPASLKSNLKKGKKGTEKRT